MPCQGIIRRTNSLANITNYMNRVMSLIFRFPPKSLITNLADKHVNRFVFLIFRFEPKTFHTNLTSKLRFFSCFFFNNIMLFSQMCAQRPRFFVGGRTMGAFKSSIFFWKRIVRCRYSKILKQWCQRVEFIWFI